MRSPSDGNSPFADKPHKTKNLLLLIWPLLLVLVIIFALTGESLKILSASRAWVKGESDYSKGQKEATYHLVRYAQSRKEQHYQRYRQAIAIPLADYRARLELQEPHPSLAIVHQELRAGNNHPDDIPGMIFLFRNFHNISHFKTSIALWTQADAEISALHKVAIQLHERIGDGAADAEIHSLLEQVDAIDQRLTPIERDFSNAVGQASRRIADTLAASLLATALVLLMLGIYVTRRILNRDIYESALRISEERFNTAVAGSNAGIWDWNRENDQYYFSDKIKQMLGYAEDELDHFELTNASIYPSDQQRVQKALNEHLDNNTPYDIEYRLRHKSGEYHWFRSRGRAVRNAHGRAMRMAGAIFDITDQKLAETRLSHQASHDALTGIFNRAEFENRLRNAIQRTQEMARNHTLLYIDLDQFKLINDTCGHAAGDTLLCQIAAHLQCQLREGDILARLGGDEFGILLENCTPGSAVMVAEKLRKTINEAHFFWKDSAFNISVSIGIFHIDQDTCILMEIMSNANVACYMAKEEGRNRVCVYQSSDGELTLRHQEMGWAGRIQQALAENRLRLYAQEIATLGLGNKEGKHFEILVRLVEEDGTLIEPTAFIPAAERYGFMSLIDRWVINSAFTTYAEAAALGYVRSADCFAINLSGTTFNDEDLLDYVGAQFALHHVPYSAICFEITETAAIANLGRVTRFMDRFRALGCQFSLDDFGVGTSSFAHLKNLPVDFLKIDGSLVKDMADSPIDQALVGAINQIGQLMGKKTIAEWVETDAVLACLPGMGVDFAQGYAISMPQPFSPQTFLKTTP